MNEVGRDLFQNVKKKQQHKKQQRNNHNNKKKTKQNIKWLHTAHPAKSKSLDTPRPQIDLKRCYLHPQ